MKIRQVDVTDPLNQRMFIELDKECFPKDAPCDPSVGVWWIALDGSKPAGYASLLVLKEESYLQRAGVVPEKRGHGLHIKLIRVRLNYAKRLGVKWVVTDTIKENTGCANNLIDCGFRLYDPVIPWALPNSIYFRKRI